MAGGQAQLARGIKERVPGSKISQPHVYKWLNSPNPDQMPPAEVVLAIADFLEYRMTPHHLRADLYPNPTDGLPSGASIPPTPTGTEQEPSMALGEFGEPRTGLERREEDRRKQFDPAFGEMGEPRDGDRRQDDRRGDDQEAAA